MNPSETWDRLLAQKRPVFYDGATGTFLQEIGLPIGMAPEKWVMDDPARVFASAEAYVNAGSDIILTCTFGGTPFRLLDSGLDGQAYQVNRRAAELAKEAAGDRALVAGSIGPLGRLALTLGQVTYDDAVEQFATQAQALLDGGVDLFQIESFSDLVEVHAAIEGVRRWSDRPIFVTLSFDTGGKTLVGITPMLAARDLTDWKVAAFGANCGSGPENMPHILREMRSVAPDAMLIAKPNAGIPTLLAGKAVYSIDEEQFAAFACQWVDAGAKIIGGCCGTTPRYIQALRTGISQQSTPETTGGHAPKGPGAGSRQ